MSEVVVKVRENGPFLVSGPFKLVDHLGNSWDLSGKENVALCRCGQSAKRPFCDGTHRTCGFASGEPAPVPTPAT
jgi:CDGSH-type Zn-finger protein